MTLRRRLAVEKSQAESLTQSQMYVETLKSMHN